jgi:hypothetical protein
MKKISLLIFLILGVIGGTIIAKSGWPLITQDSGNVAIAAKGTTSSGVEDKTVVEYVPGKPVSFRVPRLGIDTTVEEVGLDDEGAMDVPSNDVNVAWFGLGYRPGMVGSSVIAGHFDRVTGEPAVFYDLNLLEPGDQVMVVDEDGKEQIFSVQEKTEYLTDQFPTGEVFGASDEKILNLITCDGTWDPVNKSYSNRLVVSAKLVE